MADQKSRGGKKQADERQGGKQRQHNTATAKPGSRPDAQRELRGRKHMTDPVPRGGRR